MRKLTAKQERFAAELAKGSTGEAAYRAAYDAAAMSRRAVEVESQRLAKNPAIALRVAELSRHVVEATAKEIEVNLPRWLFENARIGFSDIRRALTPDGNVRPPSEWDDDTAAAVSTYEVKRRTLYGKEGPEGEEVTTKIKLWDKGTGLDRLGRHLGAYEKDNAQRGGLEAALQQLPRDVALRLLEYIRGMNARRLAGKPADEPAAAS